jgi:hypothetical protein
MTQKTSNIHFKQAFSFPEALETRIWSMMLQETRKVGRPTLWLHAPCGISRLGSVEPYKSDFIKVINVDIDESVNPDIICDVFKLTEHPLIKNVIDKGGFDGYVTDPIWYEQKRCRCEHCKKMTTFKNKKGLAYPQRRYLSYQLRDCLKEGGLGLFNCLWNPLVKGTKMAFLEIPEDHECNESKVEAADIDKAYVDIPDQKFTSFRSISLLWHIRKCTDLTK